VRGKYQYPDYTHGFIDRHGKPRFYLRLPNDPKQKPLPGLPWSPEFMAERERLMSGQIAPQLGASRTVAGTVNAALVSYYQSSAWNDGLSKGSRDRRRSTLEKFREEHGDKRIAHMHATAIQNIMNKKFPVAQRNFRKAVRPLIKHAIATGMMQIDPFATVTLTKVQRAKGEFRGHIPWTPEQCRTFEDFYPLGTRERLAYELLLQAGQSKCDVIRMGRQHVRDGMMSMSRQKTGVPFVLEVTSELQAAIDAMPKSDHLTFLVTPQGKPFTAASFGYWFREICNDAGLPRKNAETGKPLCTSHGLRKASASRLAERGGTTTELKTKFGWKTSSEADLYTEAADRKAAARSAAEKLKARTAIGKPKTQFAKTGD